MPGRVRATTVVLTALLAACGAETVFATGSAQTARAAAPAARQIRERTPTTETTRRTAQRTRAPRGFATYYAKVLDGRQTASGTTFDNDDLVAAHPTYPFGTLVRVTNLRNGREVSVRIVDRGPARRARASGVIIDLSRAAAEELGFVKAGRTRVRLDVLQLGKADGDRASADALTAGDARRTAAAGDRPDDSAR
jgi:rare lipoprotein A